jgi:CRISPR-associated exonuclease Cas4
MNITGTHINYYFSCKRQLWLFANNIQMEHTSETVFKGKLIHENSFKQRSDKYVEIEIEGIKIDFYDAKNKIIHEVKKSSRLWQAHIWQLKYYIFIFEEAGISGVKGLLEYPKERKKEDVILSANDRNELNKMIAIIDSIIHSNSVPASLNKPRCKRCSYYDFCYSAEKEDL